MATISLERKIELTSQDLKLLKKATPTKKFEEALNKKEKIMNKKA